MRRAVHEAWRRRAARRGERGAVLVLAVGGLVMSLVCAALAIDLGFIAHDARVDQKVADLAALDAVRVLPGVADQTLPGSVTVEARDSAKKRNGFDYTEPGFALLVEWAASSTSTSWSSAPADLGSATAVKVTATSFHENVFASGGRSVSRSGIASKDDKAQISVGSKLATLNAGDDTLLDKVMTAILGTSPAIDLTVLGYQGLAGGTVSLGDLVAADPTLGSPDSLLTSSITVKRLAQATLTALNNKAAGGDAAALAAATPLATFASNIDSSLMVRLGDILSVGQPVDPAAAAANAQFNVFDLILGAGEVAMFNGTNAVTISNLTLGIPGLVSSTLKLTVIEPPQISEFGRDRYDPVLGAWETTARTAQVKVELTTRITVGTSPCSGFLATCVDMQMPLVVSAAKAVGSLIDISCPTTGTRAADVKVVTTGANATANNVLTVKLLGLDLLPPLSLVSTNVVLAGGTTSPPLTFSGPPFPTPIQSTAATGAGLSAATTSQLTLLGFIPVGPVLALLSPVMTAIDNRVLGPTFNALGLSIGGADVRTMRIECGVPGLAG